ncbi:peptidase C15, pyroglutamyl peptidase I-like protein [Corynespora cassiicola Philippines]|uniref:Peptidase C15, pyroglutamyl peptidase I-like protein n=1 Tax=Corynespora cassiicola Philippines TaxID=1448308 RepID=A0A2T2NHR9_CORCC|nr:peptidase C15, pyroglutamyl peptidase I-like protein [Corynespora cassiicola Philippines]
MAPVTQAITRVLVTGFGPFGTVDINPSFAIAQSLPATLPGNIEILVHPTAIPVAYHPTIETVPQLVSSLQPDISLHIGVAEGRQYFAVEQTSERGFFDLIEDVDGQVFTEAESEALWADLPQLLSTELDLNATVEKWTQRTAGFEWPFPNRGGWRREEGGVKVAVEQDVLAPLRELQSIQDDEVRWSDAVGIYLCGFIYYAALAEAETAGKSGDRDVAFMHVPMLRGEEEISLGVDVTVELIHSLVETWREGRE